MRICQVLFLLSDGSHRESSAGKTAKTFFVMAYPRYLSDGWLAPIINLDKVFDIGIHQRLLGLDLSLFLLSNDFLLLF